jgi:hypothetical protein
MCTGMCVRVERAPRPLTAESMREVWAQENAKSPGIGRQTSRELPPTADACSIVEERPFRAA